MKENGHENPELHDEQLKTVAGGLSTAYNNLDDLYFHYNIGDKFEICDHEGLFHDFTHTGTITKLGYYHLNLEASHDDWIVPLYYFTGDKDIEGWYAEYMIADISKKNYADNKRIPDNLVTVIQ